MIEALEFNDVLIKPIPSTVSSRDDVSIGVKLSNSLTLKFPLIASPMVGVVNGEFAHLLSNLGGLAILHRFYLDRTELFVDVENNIRDNDKFGVSIRIDEKEIDEYFDIAPSIILIDTANGYTKKLLNYCEKVKSRILISKLPTLLMAGNVATIEGVNMLADAGCDLIRVGIGGGAPCSTRNQTGIGVPNLSALEECSMTDRDVKLVIDGGLKNSGDFVKAIVAGADLGMAGMLYAQCFEAPNKGTIYGMACYDSESKVLTRLGFKYFKDVSLDDEIATLNEDTGFLEYHKPINKFEYDYSGEMININSTYLDLCVTPNHELYVCKQGTKENSYISKFRKVLSKDIFSTGNYFFKRNCIWNGEDRTKFYLLDSLEFDMDDWLWFFGFWMAEGHTRIFKDKKDHTNYITGISNSNKEFIDKCKYFYDKYNIKNSIRTKSINEKYFYEITTSNKELTLYLNQFGKSLDKFIPQSIKDLNKRSLMLFLDGFNDGDGTKSKKALYTSSNFLRDDLCEILLKCGYNPYCYIVHKKGSSYKQYKRNNDSYCITFAKSNSITRTLQKNYSKKEYIGKVYCLEVPNNLLYVWRNGKMCWCGNSRTHMKNTNTEIKSVEGIDIDIEKKYSLEQFVREFGYGVRSAGTYLNAHNLNEISVNGIFIKVSDHAIKKGL